MSAVDYVLQDFQPGCSTRLRLRAPAFSTLERKTDALTNYVATVNARLRQVEALGG